MSFGLTNVPATFQVYVNDFLRPYFDDFAVCYPDDLLIYSTNEKEYEEHGQKLLQGLWECGLNFKPEKSKFGVSQVALFGFIIDSKESAWN
jgi:hypothetical protein